MAHNTRAKTFDRRVTVDEGFRLHDSLHPMMRKLIRNYPINIAPQPEQIEFFQDLRNYNFVKAIMEAQMVRETIATYGEDYPVDIRPL